MLFLETILETENFQNQDGFGFNYQYNFLTRAHPNRDTKNGYISHNTQTQMYRNKGAISNWVSWPSGSVSPRFFFKSRSFKIGIGGLHMGAPFA